MWTALCAAAQNIQTSIVFRSLSGTIGSATFVIPSGCIADMFGPEHRGTAMSVFATALFLGPTLGPLIGGFLSAAAGWRWLMGFLALYAGVLTAVRIVFVPETYPPVLLRARAKRLSQVTERTT
jgi:MFS family permease